MKVVYATRASRDIENQLNYLLTAGAIEPARKTSERISHFIEIFPGAPNLGRDIEPDNDI